MTSMDNKDVLSAISIGYHEIGSGVLPAHIKTVYIFSVDLCPHRLR